MAYELKEELLEGMRDILKSSPSKVKALSSIGATVYIYVEGDGDTGEDSICNKVHDLFGTVETERENLFMDGSEEMRTWSIYFVERE